MPLIARLGDTSDHGGVLITATSVNLYANGIRVAVNQDLHSCPIPTHGITTVTSTWLTRSGGKPVLTVGCVAGCGAKMLHCSPNVSAA